MFAGQQTRKASTLVGLKRWNHGARIEVVLRADVLTLEEELQVGREVRNPVCGVQHHDGPVEADARVAPVDPPEIVAFANGHIEGPRGLTLAAAPKIVLVELGARLSTSPAFETSSGGHVNLPTSKERRQTRNVVADQSDISITVIAPRPTKVQLERPPAAEPPTERRIAKQRDRLRH